MRTVVCYPHRGSKFKLSLGCGTSVGFRCIYGLRPQPTDSRPANRFSCNGSFPVGPERSVATRTASSERKLTFMDAMSEFDASNRNRRIGKRLTVKPFIEAHRRLIA